MVLRYDNSVLEFCIWFIPIAAKLSNIPETFLCDIFIRNLPAEVKTNVRGYKLRTLPDVISKAFSVEIQLRFQHQTSTQEEELQNDRERLVDLLVSPTKMIVPLEIPQAQQGDAMWPESNPPLLSKVAHKLFDHGKHDQQVVNAVTNGQMSMVWDPRSSTTSPSGYRKKEVQLAYCTSAPATEKKVRVAGGQLSRSDMVFIDKGNTPLFVGLLIEEKSYFSKVSFMAKFAQHHLGKVFQMA
uniref:Uncharacterized protein n=1 Tax=Cannabis sativa TaxID=3483 RepID=A0A803NFP1_CANSA